MALVHLANLQAWNEVMKCFLAQVRAQWVKSYLKLLTSEFKEHRAAPHSHSRLLRTRQDSHWSAAAAGGSVSVCQKASMLSPPLMLSSDKDESAVGVFSSSSSSSSIDIAGCREGRSQKDKHLGGVTRGITSSWNEHISRL